MSDINAFFSRLGSGFYQTPKAIAYFAAFSDPNDPTSYDTFVRLGDMDSFSIEVSVEEEEVKSNEYPVSQTVDEYETDKTTNVSMTLKQLSNVARAASIMGENGVQQQAEEMQVVKDFLTAEPGTYSLDAWSVENVTAVDDMDAALVEGTDFKVDKASGMVEIMTPCTITYDKPAISEGFISGIASGSGLRGMIVVRGVNAKGPRSMHVLKNVRLRPSGGRDLITSDTSPQSVELTGKAFPVSGGDQRYAIGYERDITAETA